MRVLSICFVLVLVTILSGPSLAAPVEAQVAPGDLLRVVESTDQAVVLELAVDAFQVEPVRVDGQSFERLLIDGTGQTARPGLPQVPVKGTLVGLPSRQGVSLQVLEVDSETRQGFRLAPAPTLLPPDAALEVPDAADVAFSRAPDPVRYATDALYPNAPATLGETGTIRDQAVAQVRFFPVQYNPVSGEIRFHRRIRVRLTWDAGPALAASASRAPSRAYEDLLQSTLVNYADLERPPVPDAPAAGAPRTAVAPQNSVPRLKLSVSEDGIYRLTHADLVNAGFDPAGIDPRTITVSNQGAEVPIYVAGEADGRFDAQDYLLFYGVALDTLYTGTNIYWMTAGGGAGRRMATQDGAPSGSAASPSAFPATLHAEENTDYWRAMPDGEGQDHWFWGERLNAPGSRTYTFTLNNIASTSTPATVRVRLKGFSDVRGVSPDHRTRIYLNGTPISDETWNGQAVFDHMEQVDHALLQNGENTLVVESVGVPNPADSTKLVSPDQIWVNWIEVDYQDTYTAENDELRFGAPEVRPYRFEVRNFSANSITLFDISDPASVARITGAEVAADGDRYRLRFRATPQAGARYLAQAETRYRQPAAVELDQPSSWKTTTNGADYVIITHAAFLESAQRLANHRSAQGLRVAIVNVADIYDEFRAGIFDPGAIRDFLAYAYENWQAPAPTYVTLLGDAYWDYRDYKQTGTPNYVPVQIVQTDILGDTPGDSWFVTVSGADILPDMLIGRLAVQTPAQADAVVDKIIAYEQTAPDAPWKRRALLVADDDETDFELHSEEVAARLPATFTVDRVYVAGYPPGDPSSAIAQAINNGTLLVNYNGHGKAYGWGTWNGSGRIFERDPDVIGLNNPGKLPVVTVANCLNGFFVGAENQVSLAEEFQRLENRGALAVWAATALDYPSGHRLLMNHFYDAVFQRGQRTLGVATTQAKINTYAESSFWGGLVEMYVLFGDPASRLGVSSADVPDDVPSVNASGPTAGASGVAVDAEIRVVFDQPMNPDTVVLGGADDLVLAPDWNEHYTIVTYAHTGFNYGEQRTLTVNGQSDLGQPMAQPFIWSFTTAPLPAGGPQQVNISGPRTGLTGTAYTFGAILGAPAQPTTYVWEATDQAAVTHTGTGAQDRLALTWETPGEKVITVMATSAQGTATATHRISLTRPALSDVTIAGPDTGVVGQVYTFKARISPLTSARPVTYVWEASDQARVVHADRDSPSDEVSFTWTSGGTKTVIVTATNRDGTVQHRMNVLMSAASGPGGVAGGPLYVPIIIR